MYIYICACLCVFVCTAVLQILGNKILGSPIKNRWPVLSFKKLEDIQRVVQHPNIMTQVKVLTLLQVSCFINKSLRLGHLLCLLDMSWFLHTWVKNKPILITGEARVRWSSGNLGGHVKSLMVVVTLSMDQPRIVICLCHSTIISCFLSLVIQI